MTRPLTLVLVAALAALGPGCGVEPQSAPEVVDPDDVPFGLLESTTTSLALRPSGTTVCLVTEEGRVVEVRRQPTGAGALVEVLSDALSVRDGAEADAGLVSLLPSESVAGATVDDDGTATVELTEGALASLERDQQILALAQLTCTLTAQPGVSGLRVTRDDSTVEVPRQDGTLTSDPVTREDYDTLLAP